MASAYLVSFIRLHFLDANRNVPFLYCLRPYTTLFTVFTFDQVHVLGALPLRNMSRIWGYLNSLELPVWFRPYGFRLYALVFGCNLQEIEPDDLKRYASLGEFFYRKLKVGARPVDDAVLVRLFIFYNS